MLSVCWHFIHPSISPFSLFFLQVHRTPWNRWLPLIIIIAAALVSRSLSLFPCFPVSPFFFSALRLFSIIIVTITSVSTLFFFRVGLSSIPICLSLGLSLYQLRPNVVENNTGSITPAVRPPHLTTSRTAVIIVAIIRALLCFERRKEALFPFWTALCSTGAVASNL